MSIRTLRLLVGIFFLGASAFLWARHWLAPEWATRYDPLRLNLGAAFALVFGLLNVARWYMSWSQQRWATTAVRYPLQPDPSLVRPQLRPELDFQRASSAVPSPEPSPIEQKQPAAEPTRQAPPIDPTAPCT
ncbi:MAG: hypothetical protein NZ703_04555 [Gemmataceae bacterium]|nr:hypothetical protein [Gemmataceae bacterium]MCS7270335.1 hypothetical protein [Gemmataceae bacterium]MDW8243007.1 hypothetical protein [Thermogemmata sp.]